MSYYVNEYTILSAIKTVLDADATLSDLLDVKETKSKVILGMERPSVCSMPVIHLAFITRNIDTETKANQILIRAIWFVSAQPDGTENIQKLAQIGERIYDLLDDKHDLILVANHRVTVFCAESGEGSALDMQQPQGRPDHFQSLTFRMAVRRIA